MSHLKQPLTGYDMGKRGETSKVSIHAVAVAVQVMEVGSYYRCSKDWMARQEKRFRAGPSRMRKTPNTGHNLGWGGADSQSDAVFCIILL